VLSMIGYLRHRAVGRALLLEHGCEKTHNDEFRVNLEKLGVEQARFGWASIQNDGGIEAVTGRVMDWFRNENTSRPGMAIPERGCVEDQPQQPWRQPKPGSCSGIRGAEVAAAGPEDGTQPRSGAPVHEDADLTELRLGIIVREAPSNEPAQGIASAIAAIVHAGGSAIIAENVAGGMGSGFMSLFDVAQPGTAALRQRVNDHSAAPHPTLAYGQAIEQPGLHVMETPTRNLLEIITGLGGTGVDVIVVIGAEGDAPGNPMLPVIPCAWHDNAPLDNTVAIRLPSATDNGSVARNFLTGLTTSLKAWTAGSIPTTAAADFQMTRGWLGISL